MHLLMGKRSRHGAISQIWSRLDMTSAGSVDSLCLHPVRVKRLLRYWKHIYLPVIIEPISNYVTGGQIAHFTVFLGKVVVQYFVQSSFTKMVFSPDRKVNFLKNVQSTVQKNKTKAGRHILKKTDPVLNMTTSPSTVISTGINNMA